MTRERPGVRNQAMREKGKLEKKSLCLSNWEKKSICEKKLIQREKQESW